MTVDRRWRLRGWCSRAGWKRWCKASTGSRKKGALARTDAVADAAFRWPVGDGGVVDAGGGGLRLGVPRRGDPGQRGGALRRGSQGELSSSFPEILHSN